MSSGSPTGADYASVTEPPAASILDFAEPENLVAVTLTTGASLAARTATVTTDTALLPPAPSSMLIETVRAVVLGWMVLELR